jgi:peptidoglycan hydrolase-like protein with peptidoglycan-binding domain
MTRFAVIAFQKVQGLKVTGVADAATMSALASPKGPPVLAASAGGDRVEIDLGRQLLMAYRGGALVLISHISSGSGRHYCEAGHCGTAITPKGNFKILWSRSGWEKAPLGLLYNPEYFTTAGHAIHGSPSVPLYPASHGCVRIPMHTSQWFPSIVTKGEPVIVQ